MRITSNAIQRETLAAIRNTMSGIAEAQRRVTTGKRVHAASDDPVAADGILRTARRSRALEQYARNIDRADSRLRAEENVLNGITNLLTRAKELGTLALGPGADRQALDAAKSEVDTLREAAVEAANTRFGDGYLFGGDAPDQRPFDAAGIVNPAADSEHGHQVDIGGSDWFTTNHDGHETFVETNVLGRAGDPSDPADPGDPGALQKLSEALESGDPDAIASALSDVDAAFDDTQRVLSEVGARTNRLEVARSNVEALDLNLQTLRSDLEDAEIEEAVSQLVGRQMAYQSALLAASKIMSTTLTDYLR